MQHLLSMETLDENTITEILDKADNFLATCLADNTLLKTLEGRVVANLFFEPSTRTLNSFEIACERLSAFSLVPNMSTSSTVKGETLLDTIHTFEAMGVEVFIIRHQDNHTAHFVASELNTRAHVINAGDGNNEHPTQALLDLLTIRQHKPDFSSLRVAIIGDIAHSRVARSLTIGLNTMQAQEIRLIAPKSLAPETVISNRVKLLDNLEEGITDADVIVTLRIQKERMQQAQIPDPKKFHKHYGLRPEHLTLASRDAIVMHPGPMNRGIEVDSTVADGPQSVILQQVRNGVAVRMAVINFLFNN